MSNWPLAETFSSMKWQKLDGEKTKIVSRISKSDWLYKKFKVKLSTWSKIITIV